MVPVHNPNPPPIQAQGATMLGDKLMFPKCFKSTAIKTLVHLENNLYDFLNRGKAGDSLVGGATLSQTSNSKNKLSNNYFSLTNKN